MGRLFCYQDYSDAVVLRKENGLVRLYEIAAPSANIVVGLTQFFDRIVGRNVWFGDGWASPSPPELLGILWGICFLDTRADTSRRSFSHDFGTYNYRKVGRGVSDLP